MRRFSRQAPIAAGVVAVAATLAAVLSVVGAASPTPAPALAVTPESNEASPPDSIAVDLVQLGPSTTFSLSSREFVFFDNRREAAVQRAVRPEPVASVQVTDPLIGSYARDIRSVRDLFEGAERFPT